jgi:hypothetical protein
MCGQPNAADEEIGYAGIELSVDDNTRRDRLYLVLQGRRNAILIPLPE